MLISVPGILMLVGGRAKNLEGAIPPKNPGIHLDQMFDKSYVQLVQDWFAFHLPTRDEAIAANSLVDIEILSDQPTPSVVVGDDGWYFTADDAERYACVPNALPASSIRNAIDRAHETATAAGLKFFVILTPDKTPIERSHRPSDDDDIECVLASNESMREQIGRTAKGWRPDLWSVMDDVKSERGSVFYQTDSHMNPYARVSLVEETIEMIAPGLWNDRHVHEDGLVDRPTDLSRQVGLAKTETWPNVRVERPGVTTTPQLHLIGVDNVPESFVEYRSKGAQMVPGKTVIIHDSQFVLAAADLVSWFGTVEFINWNLFNDPRVATTIASADNLIVESVQRGSAERLHDYLPTKLDDAMNERGRQ